MKYLFIILFLVISCCSYGQCDESLSISEQDKESFVKAYLDVKKEKPYNWDEQLYALVAKYNITPQQFREIQHPELTKRSLTSKEIKFSDDIEEMRRTHNKQLNDITDQNCVHYNISRSTYEAVLHQYQSCMKFQRSLSDYFKKWMK